MTAARVRVDQGPEPYSDRLIYDRYLPVVRRITMRLVRRMPHQVSMDDLISVGWLGLVEALQRRGSGMDEEQFEAYASHRIRGAILDHLRSLDPMSRKMRGASRKISSAIATVTARQGRAPEEQEIADELGLGLEAYRTLLGEVSQADAAWIELTDLCAPHADSASEPDSMVSRKQVVDLVTEAIDALPDRLRLVLGLYYQEECSLREIGEVLSVTESRVCQLHAEAIHRIRAHMEVEVPPRSGSRGGSK